jgi:hypothetical protein
MLSLLSSRALLTDSCRVFRRETREAGAAVRRTPVPEKALVRLCPQKTNFGVRGCEANSLVTNHMSVPTLRDGRGDQDGSARSAIATVTASSVLAASPVKSSAPIATVAASVVATPSAPVVAAVAAKHTIPVVDAELQPQAKRPKGFTLSEQAFDAAVLTSDPAMQSRMESLLKEVCLLAQALAAPVW